MENICYDYNGMSWMPSPTTSDYNSFFHAAFGMRIEEDRAYFDKQAEFRRICWGGFLTYFKNEDNMPSCLADIMTRCLFAKQNYKQASIQDNQHFTKYIFDIMNDKQAITMEEIPILATLENVKVIVFSDEKKDPLAVIEPNPNILVSYPKASPKGKPREVVLYLEENIFTRLDPVSKGCGPKSDLNKVERKIDPSKYRKGGSAGSEGVEYQIRLLTLVILNALKNALNGWKLSTENEEAGKFDDIILEWSGGVILIQSKHKKDHKKRITLEELTSINSQKNKFSLPKYFLYYLKCKKTFNIKNVIICTNADVHEKALKFLNRHPANSENLLHHEEGSCSFYMLNDNFLPDLKEKTIRYYEQNFKNKGIEESAITNENLKDFSKHLQIYFNYLSLKNLKKTIENLLSFAKYCSNSQGKITSLEIFSKVTSWFQHKKGVYFTEIHAKAMFAEIWRDKYCQKLEQYEVTFQKNDLNFQGSKQIFHVTASHERILQAIKVYQALQSDTDKSLFVNPNDDINNIRLILEAFELPQFIFLVFIRLEVVEEPTLKVVCSILKNTLNKNKYKKVILITPCNEILSKYIGCNESDYDIVNGSVVFENLSRSSQEMLLKKENLLFQGKYVCLKKLLTTDTTENYLKAIDSEILEKIITGEEVKVGTPPLGLDENTARFYINRTLRRSTDEIYESDIYNVKEDVVLISDNAGMGKSTVLSKLATTIKESNPHLWVIKIVLTEYTGILRDLKNSEEIISVAKLLNSKEETKLMNNFERFVFFMDKKVVLMIDGIDEISPDYTELVLTLLTHCLQATNFAKLFLTTRPHMAPQLENIFKIKSYVLQPFTKQNQVNFLVSYWVHNLDIYGKDKKKCEHYSKALIDKMSSWTKPNYYNYEVDFTAIPLQLRMLAEIFQESLKQNESSDWEGCWEYLNGGEATPKLPQKIYIKALYDMFIEKKKDIYLYKGNPSGNSAANRALSKQFDESLTWHKNLALRTILNKWELNIFSSYLQDCDDLDEHILKIGIVQGSINKLNFIHRTFAEYFVAESLSKELNMQLDSPNVEYQKFFIDKVLQFDEFRVVRSFLDNFLLKIVNSFPPNIFESYQSHIEYSISFRYNNDKCLVHLLAGEGCVSILQLILKCVNFKIIKDKEVKIEDYIVFKNKGKFQYLGMRIKDNSLNGTFILVQEAGINIRDGSGRTPLHIAATRGQFEMVKFLVKEGAKIDSVDELGTTALHYAFQYNHLDIIKFLVELGANFNIEICRSTTPLHFAVEKGYLDMVKFLCGHGVDVNETDNSGETPVNIAASNGRLDIIKYFHEVGVDFNTKGNRGTTALHMAAQKDHLPIIKYLLDVGVDSNVADDYGQTPLYFAAENNSLAIVQYLVRSKADVNIKQFDGRTALHNVVHWEDHSNIVKFLLKSGADVNMIDKNGYTALHSASEGGHLDIVKLLHKHGANLNNRNNEGKTALHLAALSGHLDVVKLLIELDADFTARDKEGLTPLHLAASDGYFDIVNCLLEAGADFSIENNDSLQEHYQRIADFFDHRKRTMLEFPRR